MFLKLDKNFKNFLTVIQKQAKALNKRIFIVGGAVRDYYLDIDVKDFDLILEGNAIEFAQNLPDFITVKSIHKDFGTVKLLFEGFIYDLASTRSESYPYNGCLPVVDKIGISVEEDVKRRDFTINSMYFEILDNLEVKLFDPLGGLNDIKNKKLKVLHDNSYLDDPTRVFRGLAFKYRFGFDFSEHDKRFINHSIQAINRENMSHDRLLNVFKKSISYPFGLVSFKEIIENKYYKFLNTADLSVDFEKIKDVISVFELNYSEFADLCSLIIMMSDIKVSDLYDYKYFSKLTKTDLAYYFYKTGDKLVLSYLDIKDIKLSITGQDLLNLGYKQGKLIGDIMDKLLSYKQNNPDTAFSKSDEIKLVKTLFPLN